MKKYVLIVMDKEDENPFIYPGKIFDSRDEAEKEALQLLKDSYGDIPVLDEYDADEIEDLEDPEVIVVEDLAHYYGASWDFKYLVDEIDI